MKYINIRSQRLRDYLIELRLIAGLPPLSEEQLSKKCRDYLFDPHGEWVDVFSEEHKVIGFIIIGHAPNCHPDADYYIEEAYIMPEYRRKKYMSNAVSEYLKSHKGTYCLFIISSNKPALSFWSKAFRENGYFPLELKEVLVVEPHIKQYGFTRIN